MGLFPLGPTLPYTASNLNNFRNFLEVDQCIDGDRLNQNKVSLATTFYKPAGEGNPYVWFGYVPLTIF